ncbi:hypothetical protein V2123_002280 [Enterococcus faecium]|nr:hypothetical protein [Enterococcus faecium]EGP5169180.1 hypothetical protein [Enterococcus faecium]EGP5559553.1 hypothetical protein [Enterococcus faecium]EME3541940.1 hypothetical protein [Enterococcus faecium]EME7205099.1 hypothetical protein [Enterococcus faecium]
MKENSKLNHLYAEKEKQGKGVNEAIKRVITEFPHFGNGALGMWSRSCMGLKVGSPVEEEYETELTKKKIQGYRIFKKNSPTLKVLNDLIGESLDDFNGARANYKFELHTQYGINNVSGTHFIDGQLYVGLRGKPEKNSDELEPVDYKEYLSLYINSQQQEEK